MKNITVKTTKLTKKRVGSKAFSGIHAKAAIKVPKKKLSAYRKMLKARGATKKEKVQAKSEVIRFGKWRGCGALFLKTC